MKRLLYSFNTEDLQNILNYGLDVRIEIESTIRQKIAASDADVGPIKDPLSNEINPAALEELENECFVHL